jgi:hypothetical protein
VRGELGLHPGANAVDQVEHARRQAGLVDHFSQQQRRQRRALGRFEHDRATGRQCGGTSSITWFIGQFHGVIRSATPMGS